MKWKSKQIPLTIAISIFLVLAVTGTACATTTNTYTKEVDGDRTLVLEEYSSENQTAENLTAEAEMTLPKIMQYKTEYEANYTTNGTVEYLNLTVGNSSSKDVYNLNTGGGSVLLNYSKGDYYVNFTMNSNAYLNVTISFGTITEAFDTVSTLIMTFVPIALIVAIIGSIVAIFKGGTGL